MSKLYVNMNEIRNFDSGQPTVITLSKDKKALYRSSQLHENLERWIKGHERDSGSNFGKSLFSKVLMGIAEASVDSAPSNDLEAELFGRIKENKADLFTDLLIDGVKDKKLNQANLNSFMIAMKNDCAQILAYEDVVRGAAEEAEIEQIYNLARARDDVVYARLVGAEFNSFAEADSVNFDTIIARAQILKELFASSRTFNRINCNFIDPGDNDLHPALMDAAFTVTPEQLCNFPNNVKIVKCKLNSKNLMQIPTGSELRFETHHELLAQHDIIEYRNDQGEVCYSVLDPQLICVPTNERE